MRARQTSAAIVAVSIALAGCAGMNEEQQSTAKGAGIGALGGAAIGALAGGSRGAAIGAAVGAGAGAIVGNFTWSKKMEDQKRAMEQSTQGTGVQVSQTADNQLKLEVPSDVSFNVGSADIQPNLRPILDRFATTLNQNPTTSIRIIGHTDSTGSDAVNNPLSVNRAASVRDYLVARGVAGSRIAIDGRGSHEPIADNASAEGRAKNRRVEIYVGEPAVAQAPATR